jgi:Fanconi anemia group M protein
VPEVDLVLFYEPVPTAIRAIQRKGRTGRQTEGAVTVLLAEDTRDEAYFWKARQDQKRMKDELRSLKSAAGEIESALSEQVALDEVDPEAGDTERDGDSAETTEASGSSNAADGSGDGTDGQTGLDSFAEEGDDKGGQAEGDTDGSEDDEGTESVANDPESDADETEGVVATAGTDDDDVEVVADQRELDSTIARDLSTREGIETRLETLEVGDYVLSDRVVVERKTVEDFLDTLTGGDRSMFEQLGDAARNYGRPVVVIEGGDLYGERNVHPKAIHGALASLAVDFGASVMQTAGEEETADLLEVIATREQEQEDREVSVHGEKQSKTLSEQQEYVVASIAEVGPVTARALLADLGSVEAVMTADEEDLLDVEGVGPVTAERIREVVSSGYEP